MDGKSRKGFVHAGNAAASQAGHTMEMWAIRRYDSNSWIGKKPLAIRPK
jgi:hypothetical protein